MKSSFGRCLHDEQRGVTVIAPVLSGAPTTSHTKLSFLPHVLPDYVLSLRDNELGGFPQLLE